MVKVRARVRTMVSARELRSGLLFPVRIRIIRVRV